MTEINEMLLMSMLSSWSKQAYVHGFDCESINMFECMKFSESIYKGVLETSY